MAMNEEQFDALVQRLEKSARINPAKYRFRVGLLAALGYAYVFLIFLLLFGMLWASRQVLIHTHLEYLNHNLDQITIFLVFGVVQLLWVKFSPPRGVEVTRKKLPELFALIDELTTALQSARFHHILLDNEHNASVLQVPRFGFFGWQRNYLFLGLPLMQSLSPEQFRAILAHEVGHLSGNHSRFTSWIYRLRNSWFYLVERFQNYGEKGPLLFSPFFNWYAPFFRAYSFVLARSHEYEADRCAAELAGLNNAAEALINFEIKGSYLRKYFWQNIYKQAIDRSEPPDTVITNLLQQLRNEVSSKDAAVWLDIALAEKTNNEDTHPCLFDRLSAFGYLPTGYQIPLPEPAAKTAAEYFLGEALESYATHLDAEWKKEIVPVWKQLHENAKQRSQNLARLENLAKTQSLTIESAWRHAQLTAEFKDNASAIPLYCQVIAKQPHHPIANFELGCILIEEKDPAGIRHIEIGMQGDPELVIPGCKLIFGFLKRQGKEEAKDYQQRIEQNYYVWRKAKAERKKVSYRDNFAPHNLPEAEIKQIAEQLSSYPQIKEAFLVQKVVTHFPKKPFYVLGIIRRHVSIKITDYKSDTELLDLLRDGINFSGDVFGIVIQTDNRKLAEVIGKIEGASIYRCWN